MNVFQWKRDHWSAQFDAQDQARACEIAFGPALAMLSELDDADQDAIVDHVAGQFDIAANEERALAAEARFSELVQEYQQAGRRMLNSLLEELQRDALR